MPVATDLFKGSTTMTAAPGHWFLGARARRLSDCDQQRQAGSDREVARTTPRWLVLATVVFIRWSTDLDVTLHYV